MHDPELFEIIEELSPPTLLPAAAGAGFVTSDPAEDMVLAVAMWRRKQLAILERARLRFRDGGYDQLQHSARILFGLVGEINRIADGVVRQAKEELQEVEVGVQTLQPDGAQLAIHRKRLMAAQFTVKAMEGSLRSVAQALGDLADKAYVAAYEETDETLRGSHRPRQVRLLHWLSPDGFHAYRSPDVIGLNAGGSTLAEAGLDVIQALKAISRLRRAGTPHPVFVDAEGFRAVTGHVQLAALDIALARMGLQLVGPADIYRLYARGPIVCRIRSDGAFVTVQAMNDAFGAAGLDPPELERLGGD